MQTHHGSSALPPTGVFIQLPDRPIRARDGAGGVAEVVRLALVGGYASLGEVIGSVLGPTAVAAHVFLMTQERGGQGGGMGYKGFGVAICLGVWLLQNEPRTSVSQVTRAIGESTTFSLP